MKLASFTNNSQSFLKYGDTNTFLHVQISEDGTFVDLTQAVEVNVPVANDDGLLFTKTIDPTKLANGDSGIVDINFTSDDQNNLPPDDYYLEIWVTNHDGTIGIYPADENQLMFTITDNLTLITGDVVPAVAFDDFQNMFNTLQQQVHDAIANGLKGDTGAKGDPGEGLDIKGRVTSVPELPTTANEGNGYLVNEELYVWTNGAWKDCGSIQGPQGIQGIQGKTGNGISSTTIQYQISNSAATTPTGTWSNSLVATTQVNPFLWTQVTLTYDDGTSKSFYLVSSKGDKGDKGDTGVTGPVGPVGPVGAGLVVKGTVNNVSQLPTTGNQEGYCYFIGTDLYVWDAGAWKNCGSVSPDLSKYVTVTDLNNGLSTKVTDNKDNTIQVNGAQVNPYNKLTDTIGGRNLAPNTSDDWQKVSAQSGWGTTYLCDPIYEILDGETYTLQIEVRNMTNTIRLEIFGYNASDKWVVNLAPAQATNKDSKISITFTANLPESYAYFRPDLAFDSPLTGAGSYEYRRFKFAEGSVATDWTPAPEDKVNVTDMRKPASDVAGIEEVSTLQTQVDNSAVGTNLIILSGLKAGYLDPNTGNARGSATDFYSDNYIATNGATVFTFSSPDYTFKGARHHSLAMYDSNKKYLGYQSITSPTQTLSKSNVAYIRFSINSIDESGTTGNLSDWLANNRYKLEKGSVATDWCPNPEDKVNVADMRKPANDVAGIEEVNAKQDKIGYTPADDSKVVHTDDLLGGRNYLTNTRNPTTSNPIQFFGEIASTVGNVNYSNGGVTLTTVTSGETYYRFNGANRRMPLQAGQTYTLSYTMSGTTGIYLATRIICAKDTIPTWYDLLDSYHACTTKPMNYKDTFTVPDTALSLIVSVQIYADTNKNSDNTGTNSASFSNLMLEKGEVQHDWVPAPEDIADNMASKSDVTTAINTATASMVDSSKPTNFTDNVTFANTPKMSNGDPLITASQTGDVSKLLTKDKSSYVGAINELSSIVDRFYPVASQAIPTDNVSYSNQGLVYNYDPSNNTVTFKKDDSGYSIKYDTSVVGANFTENAGGAAPLGGIRMYFGFKAIHYINGTEGTLSDINYYVWNPNNSSTVKSGELGLLKGIPYYLTSENFKVGSNYTVDFSGNGMNLSTSGNNRISPKLIISNKGNGVLSVTPYHGEDFKDDKTEGYWIYPYITKMVSYSVDTAAMKALPNGYSYEYVKDANRSNTGNYLTAWGQGSYQYKFDLNNLGNGYSIDSMGSSITINVFIKGTDSSSGGYNSSSVSDGYRSSQFPNSTFTTYAGNNALGSSYISLTSKLSKEGLISGSSYTAYYQAKSSWGAAVYYAIKLTINDDNTISIYVINPALVTEYPSGYPSNIDPSNSINISGSPFSSSTTISIVNNV